MTHLHGRGLTVIFKGTSRCDAGCAWCSVGHRAGGTIRQEDLDLVLEQLAELINRRGIEHLEFTFHGGEPTLLGASFLEQACLRLEQLPVQLSLSLQSNLLHWRPQVIDTLIAHQVRIGTSIDPLETGRADQAGVPSHARWRQNFLRLAQVGDAPGAIFVVTRQALGRAADLLQEAADLGQATGRPFGLQINPVYPQGKARDDSTSLLTPQEFGQFLVEIWELWELRGRDVRLTPIQSFAERLLGSEREPMPLSCSFTGRCSTSHVGIDHELNVAGCGRRLDSGAFMGNLREASLWEILERSEERRIISTRDATLRDGACRGCRFFDLCHGGCPDDATLAGSALDEPFAWCQSYRMLFEAMEHRRQRPQQQGPRPAVRLVLEPERALDRHGHVGQEAWLLPRSSAANLGFEGGLHQLLASGGRVRVFIHGRHARILHLWERSIRSGKLQIGLLEIEGLEDTMAMLERLGATTWLDVPGLLAQGGGTVLERVLDRFLHEPSWRAQVHPFTAMLHAAFHQHAPRPRGLWGLEPGTPVEPRLGQATLDPLAERVVAAARSSSLPLAEWLELREPCRRCALLAVCGGSLAAGDGQPCSQEAKALVARIAVVAQELRVVLEDTRVQP